MLIDTTARWTSPRSIARVNRNQMDARQLGLIFEERAELVERPTLQGCSLAAPNRYPVAYSAQFFKRYIALGVFRSFHDLLANHVVGMPTKAGFFARKFLEQSLRGFPAFAMCVGRGFGLQLGAQAAMAIAHRVDRLARIDLSIRIYRDMDDAEVKPENLLAFGWNGFIHLARGGEQELITKQNQIGFALPRLQQFTLRVAADKWNSHPTVNRPNRNFALVNLPAPNTVVRGDRQVV